MIAIDRNVRRDNSCSYRPNHRGFFFMDHVGRYTADYFFLKHYNSNEKMINIKFLQRSTLINKKKKKDQRQSQHG